MEATVVAMTNTAEKRVNVLHKDWAVIHRDVSFVDLDMLTADNICSADFHILYHSFLNDSTTSINCAFIIGVNQLQDKASRLSMHLNI